MMDPDQRLVTVQVQVHEIIQEPWTALTFGGKVRAENVFVDLLKGLVSPNGKGPAVITVAPGTFRDPVEGFEIFDRRSHGRNHKVKPVPQSQFIDIRVPPGTLDRLDGISFVLCFLPYMPESF